MTRPVSENTRMRDMLASAQLDTERESEGIGGHVRHRPEGVPSPEALDREPHLMPDGSIDWHWFHEQVEILEAWRDANLCIRCGKRERTRGAAVCHSGDCEGLGIRERVGACAFCGGTRKLNSGWGSPTMPLFLERCDDCRELKVPTRSEAVGQARMF